MLFQHGLQLFLADAIADGNTLGVLLLSGGRGRKVLLQFWPDAYAISGFEATR